MPDQSQGGTNKNRSYIMDGDKLISSVPLDRLTDALQSAASKYEADGRHDRAAGVREAAAAFDQTFKSSNFSNKGSDQQISNR